jgi:hypothetical protein
MCVRGQVLKQRWKQTQIKVVYWREVKAAMILSKPRNNKKWQAQ